jgi:exodeoxyribonuclease-1
MDLERDPDDWNLMSDEQVHAEIARKGTPLRRLRVNGAPTLTPLEEADELLPGLDEARLRDRARRYRGATEVCSRLIAIYTASWGSTEQSSFPEACLYSGGFVNDDDASVCSDFHNASWSQRRAIAARLRDPRLRSFADRLLYSERRTTLTAEELACADRALADRLLDGAEGGPLTLGGAIAEINRLAPEADPESRILLSDYRTYLVDRLARAAAFRSA